MPFATESGIRNQESGIRNQESGIRNQVDFGISSFLCQVVCGLDLHFFQSFSHFAVLSPSRRFDMLCQRRYNGFRNRVCRNEANMGNNDIPKIISNPSIYEKSTVDIKPAVILQQHRSLSRSGFVQRHSRCLGKRQLGCLLPRDQGSGIRDQGSGIRDQGSGIRDQVNFGIFGFLCQVPCNLKLLFCQILSHFFGYRAGVFLPLHISVRTPGGYSGKREDAYCVFSQRRFL